MEKVIIKTRHNEEIRVSPLNAVEANVVLLECLGKTTHYFLETKANLQLIQALETAQKELDPGYKTRAELQAIIQNDEEYKKLREYAISLEQRLGIYQRENK